MGMLDGLMINLGGKFLSEKSVKKFTGENGLDFRDCKFNVHKFVSSRRLSGCLKVPSMTFKVNERKPCKNAVTVFVRENSRQGC